MNDLILNSIPVIAAAGALIVFAMSRLGRKAASAPMLLMACGGAISLFYRSASLPFVSVEFVSDAAHVLLGALVFVSAAQFRVSRLATQCPASFRLAIGGAPLFLIACGVSAYVLLPDLSLVSAFALAGALMLNGAAFDRRVVMDTPAPAEIKSAVRFESAAIIALGAPAASLLTANATSAASGAPAIAPLLSESIAVLIGFALGGVLGLVAALLGNRLSASNKKFSQNGRLAVTAGVSAYLIASLIAANPVIAALGTGLVWGEQTKSPQTTRLRLRAGIEQIVAPTAFFAFGCLFAPRVLQSDLLTLMFALTAVTVLRAAPRLLILNTPKIPTENRRFLAWFGGAPGAASALFLMGMLSNAALADQEGLFTVGALAVAAGVFAARVSSKPLTNGYLRARAIAARRRVLNGA